jgi:hypothetical protein
VTGLGGFLRVFWRYLPAGWGGAGPFRAQFVKFLSSSTPRKHATTQDVTDQPADALTRHPSDHWTGSAP